jgi:hypothetical protein
MADPVTQQLKEALRATMSPERATRTAAEGALQGVEAQPGFTLTLLGLIEAALAPDATPGVLFCTRCSHYIYFYGVALVLPEVCSARVTGLLLLFCSVKFSSHTCEQPLQRTKLCSKPLLSTSRTR